MQVAELIEKGSQKDKIKAIFLPDTPLHVVCFYQFIQKHIKLQVGEMGTSFRESRYNLSKLLEAEGYDYQIYQIFIDKYEDALLESRKTK